MAGQESSSAPSSTKEPLSKNRPPTAASATLATTVKPVDPNCTKLTTYFTKSQFALALIIQRSKPDGISVSDYCRQLQKNIRQHKSISSGTQRYVDTWEFWKDQYLKIQDEKKTLEDRLHFLEEFGREQCNNTTTGADFTDDLNKNGKCSSLFDEVQELLHMREKKPSTTEATMLKLCRYILQIGRQRMHLAKIMKDSVSPEYLNNLVKSPSQILQLLETALHDCTTSLWSLKCSDDMRIISLLQQLMHQIVLSFQTCFNSLNELCLTIAGRSRRHEIVYLLAMFFKHALDHLQSICTLQSENDIKSRRKTRSKRLQAEGEYAVNKYLSQTLTLITRMDWKVGKPGHSDILEGILFSILDHIGRLVSTAVFNEHVAVSSKVGNITVGDTEPLTSPSKLETRYIVPILCAALGGSNSRKELLARVLGEGGDGVRYKTQGTSQQTLTGSGCDLVTMARKRLQETLVKCAVGGEEFNSLIMPPQPEDFGVSTQPNPSAEEYGPEWLLESVWAVVGWELATPS